ncbi:hypothetical protein THRCLA_21670 [Thraustotheca clavata]|uniref:Secreted protein n=1 Tax=Thraustotheca clavata TaxID=74557 RepID=A0A1V9ZRL7_9STRA|nr:hypothetical protein THRCLA_21670 [Thraustotheca clavata]
MAVFLGAIGIRVLLHATFLKTVGFTSGVIHRPSVVRLENVFEMTSVQVGPIAIGMEHALQKYFL